MNCCTPQIIPFTNVSGISIPYTAEHRAAYGAAPTVKVYILDAGDYVEPVIDVRLLNYPVTEIVLTNFGGAATGFVKLAK